MATPKSIEDLLPKASSSQFPAYKTPVEMNGERLFRLELDYSSESLQGRINSNDLAQAFEMFYNSKTNKTHTRREANTHELSITKTRRSHLSTGQSPWFYDARLNGESRGKSIAFSLAKEILIEFPLVLEWKMCFIPRSEERGFRAFFIKEFTLADEKVAFGIDYDKGYLYFICNKSDAQSIDIIKQFVRLAVDTAEVKNEN